MYKQFFRLKENPFKLAPDPAYLFLSTGHEEALAHLRYGISEGEGFISLTGTRGVGKTLICATLIEGLSEKIKVAYFSNPVLSSEQLLKKIHRKFKISSDEHNAKSPLDALYSFLMEQRRGRKRVVLIIDEAQKLEKDAFEQIRLLSNLETSRDKLLQIVLVGQPELIEMLNSYELRQMRQRIIDFFFKNQSKLIIAGCCISLGVAVAAYLKMLSGSTSVYNFEELKKVTTFQRDPQKLLKLTTQSSKSKDISNIVNKSADLRNSESSTILKLSQSQQTARETYFTSKMTHSIQVGAFLIKKNAEMITSKLRKKGYDARMVIFNDSKKRIWHTVRIGDYPSREIAREYADAFTAKEKRESAVVPVDNL